MSLSKKHYDAISSLIHVRMNASGVRGKEQLYLLIEDLAHYFAQDNKEFKDERFMEACGYYESNLK